MWKWKKWGRCGSSFWVFKSWVLLKLVIYKGESPLTLPLVYSISDFALATCLMSARIIFTADPLLFCVLGASAGFTRFLNFVGLADPLTLPRMPRLYHLFLLRGVPQVCWECVKQAEPQDGYRQEILGVSEYWPFWRDVVAAIRSSTATLCSVVFRRE